MANPTHFSSNPNNKDNRPPTRQEITQPPKFRPPIGEKSNSGQLNYKAAEWWMGDNQRLSVADCLRQIEECRRLAVERNLSEVQRTMLEYIADTWERLSKNAWGAR